MPEKKEMKRDKDEMVCTKEIQSVFLDSFFKRLKKIISLKVTVSERERELDRNFPSAGSHHSRHGWARLEPGTGCFTQVSHVSE